MHRKTIYVIVRNDNVVLDSFASWEEADNRAGALAQEYLEKYSFELFTFTVQASTFYNV